MGRQWNQIIESLGPLTGGTMSINANLTDIEALLTTLQADVADGIIVSSGTANTNLRDGSGNPITSTTSGTTRRLDVMLSSGGTTGSAVPTNANLIGGTDGTNLRGLNVDTSGRLNTNINSGTVTANNQSCVVTTSTLSGTSVSGVDLIPSTDVTAYSEVLVQVTGTWPTGATVQHQVSNDNVNFSSIVASNANAVSGGLSTTITTTGSVKVVLGGFAYYRLRVTVAGSAGTYSYSYSLNPRSSVFNTSVSVSSAPTTLVQIQPTALYGHATYHTAISAASTNATNVKTTNANVASLNLVNTTASLRYFKVFNLATAPTMGTSTPVLNYAITPNSSVSIDCGFGGIRLSNGLSYAITAGQALLDTTAVGAGDVLVNIAYA